MLLDMGQKTRQTVREIVKLLGGREAVAELCGVGYNAVSNWCAWNAFPPRLYLVLAPECRTRKLKLPVELFEPVKPRAKQNAVA